MERTENDDGSSTIKLEKDESALIFDRDGDFVGFMTDGDDFLIPSAQSLAIAMVALLDPKFRQMIEQHLQEKSS